MQSVALPASVAIELLHALVGRVATDAGVRMLIIKGPTLARQGLRPERVSADVDVLVDPAGLPALVGALRAAGWHERRAAVDSPHSITLVHDGWRGDLDLHRHIPGLTHEPSAAFEVLWNRREPQSFAGHPVAVPDLLGQAVLLALHSLRNAGDRERDAELATAVAVLRRASVDDVTAIVHGLGAGYALRGVLQVSGIPVEPGTVDSGRARAWRFRMSPAYGTYIWLMHIHRSPWRQKPAAVLHALWLSEAELRAQLPPIPAGRRALASARWRRLIRGLAAVPKLVRARRANP